jgi:hypothetical protein
MTFAQNYCEANLSQALTLLLDRLGERPIYMDEVVNDDLAVAHIHRTTWQELTDRKLVTARTGIGCCRYQLTGSGWREALKLTGQLDTPEFQERFGRLNAILKLLVNGRKDEAFAQTHIVAAQARIPEAWLYNMLESRIWEHEQRRRGAALDDSKTVVVVPIDFNMPLSQPHGSCRDHHKGRLAMAGTPHARRPAWVPSTSFFEEIRALTGRFRRVVLGRERNQE